MFPRSRPQVPSARCAVRATRALPPKGGVLRIGAGLRSVRSSFQLVEFRLFHDNAPSSLSDEEATVVVYVRLQPVLAGIGWLIIATRRTPGFTTPSPEPPRRVALGFPIVGPPDEGFRHPELYTHFLTPQTFPVLPTAPSHWRARNCGQHRREWSPEVVSVGSTAGVP